MANIMDWVESVPVKGNLKQVLVCMAHVADKNGRCRNLSFTELSKRSGLNILKTVWAIWKLTKLRIVAGSFKKKFYYLRVQIPPDASAKTDMRLWGFKTLSQGFTRTWRKLNHVSN